MRSFAEYRKSQLREAIEQACLEEGIQKHFDILRIDLLEAVKLPAKPQDSILAEVQYNQTRKQDYAQTSYFVEQFIQVCKEDFYQELMAEAAASADAGASLKQLKKDLLARIKKFTTDLRAALGAATGGARNQAAPDASGGAAPAGQPQQPQPQPQQPQPAADGMPGWRANRGEERPADGGGFQPAAYGSFKPSDGIMGGLGRLFRRATRPIRRIWHGDPNREMAKEHIENLTAIFSENQAGVEDIIAAFERDMEQLINTRVKEIVGLMGAAPAADPAAAADPNAGKAPVGGNVDSVDQEVEDEGEAARQLAAQQGASPEEAEQQAEEAKEQKLAELAKEGAAKLGIGSATLDKIVHGIASGHKRIKGGGDRLDVIPPKDWIDLASGQPLGASAAPVVQAIAERIFDQLSEMNPSLAQAVHSATHTGAGKPRAKGVAGRKLKVVKDALQLKGGKSKATIADMLARYSKAALKGSWDFGEQPAPEATPEAPAPEAPTPEPQAEAPPQTPPGTKPVGGDVDTVGDGVVPVDSLLAAIKQDNALYRELVAGFEGNLDEIKKFLQGALRQHNNDVEAAKADIIKTITGQEPEAAPAAPASPPENTLKEPPEPEEEEPEPLGDDRLDDREQPAEPAPAEPVPPEAGQVPPDAEPEAPQAGGVDVSDPVARKKYVAQYVAQLKQHLGYEGKIPPHRYKGLHRAKTEAELDELINSHIGQWIVDKINSEGGGEAPVDDPKKKVDEPVAEPETSGRLCATCGKPEHPHNYRHPFVPAEPEGAEPEATPVVSNSAPATPIEPDEEESPAPKFEPYAQHADPNAFFDNPDDDVEPEEDEAPAAPDGDSYDSLRARFPKLSKELASLADYMDTLAGGQDDAGKQTFDFILDSIPKQQSTGDKKKDKAIEKQAQAQAADLIQQILQGQEGPDGSEFEDEDEYVDGSSGDYYDDPDEAIRKGNYMKGEEFREKLNSLKKRLFG